MAPMATTTDRRLTDYAERLRRLHNTVRSLLPAAEQDELLELAVSVGLMASAGAEQPCWCGHSQDRHRDDPIVCLDCWHTPAPVDSVRHEHGFQSQRPGEAQPASPVL